MQMPDFKAKMHQIGFWVGLLGELTALIQTPYLDLRGPTSKGTGREGREKRKRKVEKVESDYQQLTSVVN